MGRYLPAFGFTGHRSLAEGATHFVAPRKREWPPTSATFGSGDQFPSFDGFS